MTITEKRIRLEEIFELQKKFIQNISLENYFDTLQKVRQLELQKEMVKAIPSFNSNEATEIIKTFGEQINKCGYSIQQGIVNNQPKA